LPTEFVAKRSFMSSSWMTPIVSTIDTSARDEDDQRFGRLSPVSQLQQTE
jgi:hypothetical protein